MLELKFGLIRSIILLEVQIANMWKGVSGPKGMLKLFS